MSEASQSEKMKHLFIRCNSGQTSIKESSNRETDVQDKPLNNPVSIISDNLPLDLSIRNRRILVDNCGTNDIRQQFSNFEESSMPCSEIKNPDFIRASMSIDSLMLNKTASEFSSKGHQQKNSVKMDQLLPKDSLANSEYKKFNAEFESKITAHNNEMVPKLSRLSERSHQFSFSEKTARNSVFANKLENMSCLIPIKEYKPNQQLKSNKMSTMKKTHGCISTGENRLTFGNQIYHGNQKQIAQTKVLDSHSTKSIQPCSTDAIAAVIGPSCSFDSERTCAICKKEFSTKRYLKLHYRIHSGERLFTCNICHQKFTLKGALSRHVREIYSVEKPYKCEICGNIFSRKNDLEKHIRIHLSDKPYKCGNCGKSFTRKDVLREHIRIHTGEKPYKCDNCGKSFTRKEALRIHIRIHTGEKPYKCNICSRAFAQKSSLNLHSKRRHKDT